MNKTEFLKFYDNVVKRLGKRLVKDYPEFSFCDNPEAVYEEYLNQKTLLRILYVKEGSALLDRHKVCACMTVAIVKVRLLSSNKILYDILTLEDATRVNEQLAFMSVWELFLGFIKLHKQETEGNEYVMPKTYHNNSFLDTITRSLFYSNQINALSTPLIANIFYLLEKYYEAKNEG